MKTERFRTIYCPACSGVGSMWGRAVRGVRRFRQNFNP